MTSIAERPDPIDIPGLSGAEVANFVQLLKKILNNPLPDSDTQPKDEKPRALPDTPVREVDPKGIEPIEECLCLYIGLPDAPHPADQSIGWRKNSL